MAGSAEAARGAVDSSRRDATLEAHLEPVCNVFRDFLEIFPKWYGATVLAEIRGSTPCKGNCCETPCDHRLLSPVPAGTTADMILRHDADGPYEIYDIGNNAFLAANFLGQVGTDFQVAGLGRFFGSDTTDMLLRHHRLVRGRRARLRWQRSLWRSMSRSPQFSSPNWAAHCPRAIAGVTHAAQTGGDPCPK